MVGDQAQRDLRPRWSGRPGRLEVWYATVSDPVTGAGFWVHHELVAPTAGDPFVHGWAALFGAGRPPELARFGPEPADPTRPGPSTAAARLEPPRLAGTAGDLSWELQAGDATGPTLHTFPAWAWRRELLPAAQIVPLPSVPWCGVLRSPAGTVDLSPDARGGVAHIYGHGNAERWGWLHAELGGGDVLEVVAAVSRRPGMRGLRPLPFVQLRLGGEDWPRRPLAAAVRLQAELGLPRWEVRGSAEGRRLRVAVDMPEERCVTVDYADPDGAPARCTNTETADAEVVLETRGPGRRWATAGRWRLAGTAHAEIGRR